MVRRGLAITFVCMALTLACGPAPVYYVVDPAPFGPGVAVVSGRVDDPHGLRTPDSVLMMWGRVGDGGSGAFVPTHADGTFTTPQVPSGTYLFEIVRTPHSAVHPATPIGVAFVDVKAADVGTMVIAVRRDMELRGTYRIESDRPRPVWPSSIHVSSDLIFDDTRQHGTPVEHGAPNGQFILRNAYGPRILSVTYSPADGPDSVRARIFLDGRDITDVPTDFSEHVNAVLEAVITDRPSRVVGSGAVPNGWVVMFSADPRRRQEWASTSHIARANADGQFVIAANPGSYIVRTTPMSAAMPAIDVLRGIPVMGSEGHPVALGERETVRVRLRPI